MSGRYRLVKTPATAINIGGRGGAYTGVASGMYDRDGVQRSRRYRVGSGDGRFVSAPGAWLILSRGNTTVISAGILASVSSPGVNVGVVAAPTAIPKSMKAPGVGVSAGDPQPGPVVRRWRADGRPGWAETTILTIRSRWREDRADAVQREVKRDGSMVVA